MRIPVLVLYEAWERCVFAGLATKSPFHSDWKFRQALGVTNKQWRSYMQDKRLKVNPAVATKIQALANIPRDTPHLLTMIRAFEAKHNVKLSPK